jgi:hypothetical protein
MESADCLCINCEEMISFSATEAHSAICDKVASYVYQLENSQGLKLTNFKLDKLKCAMESVIHAETIHDLNDVTHLKKLIKLASNALLKSTYSKETVSELTSYTSQIATMELVTRPFVLVYAERLKNLCNVRIMQTKIDIISELIYEVQDTDSVQKQIHKQALEFKKLEQELKYYKRKTHLIQAIFKTQLSEVTSSVNSASVKSDFDALESSIEEDVDYGRNCLTSRNIKTKFKRFDGFDALNGYEVLDTI